LVQQYRIFKKRLYNQVKSDIYAKQKIKPNDSVIIRIEVAWIAGRIHAVRVDQRTVANIFNVRVKVLNSQQ
jgi:hypothetical protein